MNIYKLTVQTDISSSRWTSWDPSLLSGYIMFSNIPDINLSHRKPCASLQSFLKGVVHQQKSLNSENGVMLNNKTFSLFITAVSYTYPFSKVLMDHHSQTIS